MNELLREEIEEVEQENKGFKVTDIESANWCFRKLRALEAEEADYELLAQKEIDRISTWLNSKTESIENQKAFFEGLLTDYATDQRKSDPKFKISTPYGKVTFKKAQPKWNYDDAKVVECLKTAGYAEYIRTKEEINKPDLKKAATVINGIAVITETGEPIEGITIEEQPESINIKTEV